ncbi:hypothetical protein ABEB36_013853 [Hypothenemus hampei]|uniref:Odorant receptor n=1 Tax=Hypothenemus hampei TaxID=57062 RepID=A0ABD1E5G7_HYPHA
MSLQDYLRSDQLKYIFFLAAVIGLHPIELISSDKKTKLSFLFKFYSYFVVFILITYFVSCYTKIYILLNMAGDEINILETARCFVLSILINIPILIIFLVKQQPYFQMLFTDIYDTEEFFRNTDDYVLKEIYDNSVKNYINNSKMLSILLPGAALTLVFRPFVEYEEHLENGVVDIKRQLPAELWFPYDTQIHFWKTYFVQILWCVVCGCSAIFSYFVMFCVIFYAIGQLRIMHYIINNFKTYQSKLVPEESEIDPAEFTIKFIINKHQKVINFIDTINKALGMVIMFDFLQNSIQITCVLVEIYERDVISVSFALYVTSLFSLIIYRLFILSFNCHEITLLSQLLANNIYQGEWYNESRHFKFMLKMFIMRCLKPLFIRIGPFGAIGLPSLISVFKATYSYIMLFINIQE